MRWTFQMAAPADFEPRQRPLHCQRLPTQLQGGISLRVWLLWNTRTLLGDGHLDLRHLELHHGTVRAHAQATGHPGLLLQVHLEDPKDGQVRATHLQSISQQKKCPHRWKYWQSLYQYKAPIWKTYLIRCLRPPTQLQRLSIHVWLLWNQRALPRDRHPDLQNLELHHGPFRANAPATIHPGPLP